MICLTFTAAICGADDKPAEPLSIKHRVTGLFSPDREDDLREVLEKLPDVKLVSIDYQTSEATFTYDAAKLFAGAKPEQHLERFDTLLRSVSSSTFGIAPLCTTPKDKLTRIEIPVVGLDCKACCLAAYEAIYKLDGVEQATASFKDGRVTALIDPEKTNRKSLEEALKSKRVELAPQR
ncbi:MAG: cation transporter [Planctomycetota bacterium]